MKRPMIALFGLVGVLGLVGTTATAAGSPSGRSAAPDKTVAPTSPGDVPTSAGNAPTSAGNVPTSAWIPTTTVTAPAPTAPTTAGPPPTVPGPTTAPSPTTVSTTAPATGAAGFDGLALFTEIYTAVNATDTELIFDTAEQRTIRDSSAELFVVYLAATTFTDVQFGAVLPTYTVAADGKGVQVCADTGQCDVFGDFFAPTGLLESFSMNGVPIDDRLSVSPRAVQVESLSIDFALCLQRADLAISCVVPASAEGGSVAFSWDQAVITSNDGQAFALDPTQSFYAPSVADGGFTSAHLVFPGGPLLGEITLPIVSGLTGTPIVVTIPVRAV
jgi:hypothetical protein